MNCFNLKARAKQSSAKSSWYQTPN